MTAMFKIADDLVRTIHEDLSRHHPFALERVGFITCNVANLADDGIALYAAAYHPVADDDYIRDRSAAAMLGPGAFRKILQRVYNNPASVVHVHRHEHLGRPRPSPIDQRESKKFVPDFWKVCPQHPHGIVILSHDSLYGLMWHPDRSRIIPFDPCVIVKDPMHFARGADT